jgi:hypothetical protein
MSFRFHALGHKQFAHYFSMSPEQLREHRAVFRLVDKKPGFPCRVSLEDADLGERVLLTHFVHLPVDSPFRASHAIYVRAGVSTRFFAPGEVPELFRTRQLSLRCFDKDAMLVDAYLSEGCDVESVLLQALQQSRVTHVDVHFAKPGCFGARVTRD